MMKTSIQDLLSKQKAYFLSGNTQDIAIRKSNLKKLKAVLKENENAIADAVFSDFRKSSFEVFENELGLVYAEITKTLKHLSRWSKPLKPATSLVNLPGQSRVYPLAYGSVLIIGAWNYPVQLALIPVVSALAAGNTVILKPSELTSATSAVLADILNKTFPPEHLYVFEGGVAETTELLKHRFDKIFFTGSTTVGKIVMKAAAEHLTPVVLELGGKNPTIVLPDCDLKMTAKRIVWGKFHNGGQACVAPDHIYVHESIHDAFVNEVKANIYSMFKGEASASEAFPSIVNNVNYNRLMKLIQADKVIVGGKGNPDTNFIEPTVMDHVDRGDAIMQEEVFGPIRPI
ncbi:MAG: aldehyde dehydrogenase family protein, partial [Bacteroidales bacterium]|nr:aldehyde dehydrogenase family protein [Bacteroidales bacterium]